MDRLVIIDTKGKQIFIYAPGEVAVAPGGAAVVVEDGAEQVPQRLIAAFPITPGKAQFIHRGAWEIANSIELPSWRYDKQLLKTGKRGKTALQIPPGPNQSGGDYLERADEKRDRNSRHLQSTDDRAISECRVHSAFQLGRGPISDSSPAGGEGGGEVVCFWLVFFWRWRTVEALC